MKNKCTVINLTAFVQYCDQITSISGQVDAIHFVFSKAFDLVPHNRILLKLKCLDLPVDLINWLSTYLETRIFKVKVNGFYSDWFILNRATRLDLGHNSFFGVD